jgi:hypothetical protein
MSIVINNSLQLRRLRENKGVVDTSETQGLEYSYEWNGLMDPSGAQVPDTYTRTHAESMSLIANMSFSVSQSILMLETNRLRQRLRAIPKIRSIAYRAKVLGRALLAARTDATGF